MNLSMRWLKDYVDIGNVSMRDFSEAMSMSGSKVEGWETEFEGVKNQIIQKLIQENQEKKYLDLIKELEAKYDVKRF